MLPLRSGFIATLAMLLSLLILSFICIQYQKKGKPIHIRRIAALDAIDQAVGRATETGRPVHFSTGTIATLYTDEAPQVLAGLSCLRYIAGLTAKYVTPLIVTVADPSSLPLTEEIVREAYLKEGKANLYDQSMVRHIATEQQAYGAGVQGLFFREKVGANFLIGPIYAESLVIVEAGYRIGAMQVCGSGTKTGATPAFIAVCDYVLLGEEIFAAGAYLSRDPGMLATILAEDLTKFAISGIIILATIVTFFNNVFVTLLGS